MNLLFKNRRRKHYLYHETQTRLIKYDDPFVIKNIYINYCTKCIEFTYMKVEGGSSSILIIFLGGNELTVIVHLVTIDIIILI